MSNRSAVSQGTHQGHFVCSSDTGRLCGLAGSTGIVNGGSGPGQGAGSGDSAGQDLGSPCLPTWAAASPSVGPLLSPLFTFPSDEFELGYCNLALAKAEEAGCVLACACHPNTLGG